MWHFSLHGLKICRAHSRTDVFCDRDDYYKLKKLKQVTFSHNSLPKAIHKMQKALSPFSATAQPMRCLHGTASPNCRLCDGRKPISCLRARFPHAYWRAIIFCSGENPKAMVKSKKKQPCTALWNDRYMALSSVQIE